MARIFGLSGYRPGKDWPDKVTSPPYDVIKPHSPLEALLQKNPYSLYHVTLGETPAAALDQLLQNGVLIEDAESSFYVYEQRYGDQRRRGLLAAPEVLPYEAKTIIRHEKTFEEKVRGRIRLMEETGYVTEPIWLLTKAPLDHLLDEICANVVPLYSFTSDFQEESELSGIHNRIFKVNENSPFGQELVEIVATEPLYIADGHHRYHSALLMGLDRCIAYICSDGQARIQAYNRVIRSTIPFEQVKEKVSATPLSAFSTPERHAFAIYTKDGCWQYRIGQVNEEDVVRRLDCHILEDTLYPLLGLRHEQIMDSQWFDYYPEQDLSRMQEVVDAGAYDLAVALHPVSPEELMGVADAGLADPRIVMPEKSTFFAPKVLSGLILIPVSRR